MYFTVILEFSNFTEQLSQSSYFFLVFHNSSSVRGPLKGNKDTRVFKKRGL